EFTAAVEHFQKSDWITGVTLSGGEPTCNTHLPELIAWLHSRGLHIKLDTNGSNPDMLSKILPLLDYVAMDIKCSLDNYPSFVGYPHAEKIQESVHLLLLWDRGTAEFRTTVLESYHNKKELGDMGKLLSGANHYTLQPFVPRENLPDPALRTQPRTSPQFLKQAADIMKPYVKQVSIKGRM
nr:radical SAM protein [Spirochaetales bacterium]